MESALTGGATTEAAANPLTDVDLAAIASLRRLHDEGVAVPADDRADTATDSDVSGAPNGMTPNGVEASGATCPMPGFIKNSVATCPIRGDDAEAQDFSRADLLMRRILRIQAPPTDRPEAETYRHFRRSMTISGIRCTLTYVIFPFVLPFLSFMKGVGPVIGMVVGSVALVFDTLTVRRFFEVNHKYRWYFSAIAGAVMGLLLVLLVQDGMEVARMAFG